MKPTKKLSCMLLGAVLMTFLSTAVPLPVAASLGERSSTAYTLPPIPEWPIIGPVLKWLGVASTTPEEAPTLTPGLPEYRITTYADIQALDEIAAGERVRIIASESDLNAMILEAISANVRGDASVTLDFEPGVASVTIRADESLLEGMADDLPRQIRGDLNLTGSFGFEASACALRVEVKKINLNRWSFGLRPLAQRTINTRIPDLWPQEICIERILLMQDEAAVEGYRR